MDEEKDELVRFSRNVELNAPHSIGHCFTSPRNFGDTMNIERTITFITRLLIDSVVRCGFSAPRSANLGFLKIFNEAILSQPLQTSSKHRPFSSAYYPKGFPTKNWILVTFIILYCDLCDLEIALVDLRTFIAVVPFFLFSEFLVFFNFFVQ